MYIHTQPNNPGTLEAAVGRQVAITNQEALRQLKIKFNIAYIEGEGRDGFHKMSTIDWLTS